MAKVFRCSDIGMRCDFVARAETEDELMNAIKTHAAQVHNMQAMDEATLSKAKAAIKEE